MVYGFATATRNSTFRHESAESLEPCSHWIWVEQSFCFCVSPSASFSYRLHRHYPRQSLSHCDQSRCRKNLSSFHQTTAACGKCNSVSMTCALTLHCLEHSRPSVLWAAQPASSAILHVGPAGILLYPSSLRCPSSLRTGLERRTRLMPQQIVVVVAIQQRVL